MCVPHSTVDFALPPPLQKTREGTGGSEEEIYGGILVVYYYAAIILNFGEWLVIIDKLDV